jgi:hypothetical protein
MYYIMRVNTDPQGGGAHFVGVAEVKHNLNDAREWIEDNTKSSWDAFEIMQKVD